MTDKHTGNDENLYFQNQKREYFKQAFPEPG